MIVNKQSARRSLQNTCLVALSLVAILLVGCGGGNGLPRGAELALLDKVGSDFYIFSDTEDHGDDTYCVHTLTSSGWAKTFAVRQDGGGWEVLSIEEIRRICVDYYNGFSSSALRKGFDDMAHVEP